MPRAPVTVLAHRTQICKPARAVEAPQSRPPLSVEDNHTGHGRNLGDWRLLRLVVDVLGVDVLGIVSHGGDGDFVWCRFCDKRVTMEVDGKSLASLRSCNLTRSIYILQM